MSNKLYDKCCFTTTKYNKTLQRNPTANKWKLQTAVVLAQILACLFNNNNQKIDKKQIVLLHCPDTTATTHNRIDKVIKLELQLEEVKDAYK